jgi:integrase
MNKKPKIRRDPSKRRRFKNLFQNQRGDRCIDLSVHGRRVIRVIGKSKKEAEAALAVLKADLMRSKYDLGKSGHVITFREFADEFLKTHATQKKSYARDEGALEHHLTPFFGSYRLNEIRAQVIEKYKNKRMEQYDGRQKEVAESRRTISGSTINRELALLKTMLNKALEWEPLEVSPVNWRRVKKFPENGRERFLTPGEKTRLFEKAGTASPYLKNFLILALNTGMRKGEILGLRWRDINLADGEIIIEQARRKNKRALRMPINRVVIEVLNSMPRELEYVFYNPETKKPVQDVRTAFESACQKAGIKDLRIHDLRHTFATTLSARGTNLPAISHLLGHSSISMTAKYITQVSESMRKAVDALGDDFAEREEVSQLESRKEAERKGEEISGEVPGKAYIQ